jgi:hypothetical protein
MQCYPKSVQPLPGSQSQHRIPGSLESTTKTTKYKFIQCCQPYPAYCQEDGEWCCAAKDPPSPANAQQSQFGQHYLQESTERPSHLEHYQTLASSLGGQEFSIVDGTGVKERVKDILIARVHNIHLRNSSAESNAKQRPQEQKPGERRTE